MRVSLSWLREHVELPATLDADALERALVKVGLEVEEIIDGSSTVDGPLVIGRVESIEELTGLRKPIRYCQVEVGEAQPRGIVCGATNFVAGDVVVVALPGAVLPGDFAIAARKTYGRISDGMICSARELGLGDDHAGIIVLPADTPASPGQDARATLGLDDILVDVNITPDRGYCLSVRGVARELSHSTGGAYRDPVADCGPLERGDGTPAHPVDVRDAVGCDRFTAVAVTGVDVAAAVPQWMRQRLAVAGIRSISLPVDITNYVMIEMGQPMHAWDLGRLAGPLVVRRAEPGERLTTLDGSKRDLHPEDIVIADDSGVVSLAAVMGGATTEVSSSTVDVLLEAAHWDPISVARTIRRHKLPSEAGKRFERGVDPQITEAACARAAALLARYGGGTVQPRLTDVVALRGTAPVTIPADLPSRTAGLDYPVARVVELLTEIGAEVSVEAGERGDLITAIPPSWRPDLTDPADLVEEVVRLDGYDRVPSVLPVAPPGRGLTPTQRRRRSVGRALADVGFVETLCYPFLAPSTLDLLGLSADDPRRELVFLVNPLSETEPAMRSSLLPPLLGALRRNIGRGTRDLMLYEIGLVFHPAADGAGPDGPVGVQRRPDDAVLAAAESLVPDQPWHVAAVLAGEVERGGWWGGGRVADWADAVEAAHTVAAAAGITLTVRPGALAPWHPGRCAELVVDGPDGETVVGHAGELHPAVCGALELPRRTCAMELNLDALPLAGAVPPPDFSTFPPALLDVALVVDAGTPASTVRAALVDGAGELLESVRLFDVYTGAQVGDGRKSLAYNLTFRAPDRTLTAPEALAARDAAVALAAQRCQAVLRGV